jgi:hypothetical protein
MNIYHGDGEECCVLHAGHIGDIIAFLPIYNVIGGTKLYIKDCEDIPDMVPMSGFKYDTMEPLLSHLGVDVEFNQNPDRIDVDTTSWQKRRYRADMNLMEQQACYLGVIDGGSKIEVKRGWIDLEGDNNTAGRVIFNRTPRYRNMFFPWEMVARHFGGRALFVGTDEEYDLYLEEVGDIERYEVKDCLGVARAIKGSDYFVGNQSSSFWIAASMFHPLLQETCISCPNSIIHYDKATYYSGGRLDLDGLYKC